MSRVASGIFRDSACSFVRTEVGICATTVVHLFSNERRPTSSAISLAEVARRR